MDLLSTAKGCPREADTNLAISEEFAGAFNDVEDCVDLPESMQEADLPGIPGESGHIPC
jgi:hypothetical protein